MLIT
jgi:hypothetical protein